MDTIFKIYPIDELHKHYKNNTLKTLPNIGEKKNIIVNVII